MSDDAESCGAVGCKEAVGVWPSVEAHAEAVTRKNAVHLCESGFKPCVVIVVRHGAPVARLVAGDIGRVGEDEIDAVGGEVSAGC